MTDALNEALMKLSASRTASREPLAAAVAASTGISEAMVAVIPAPIAAAEAAEASVLPVAQAEMPQAPAETPLAASPQSFAAVPPQSQPEAPRNSPATLKTASAASFAAGSIKRLRELRGWIAMGIALALLITIWDDLRHGGSRPSGSAPGDTTAAVDIDGLLKEFETAEPAAAAQYQDSSRATESTPAPADASSAPASEAALGGLRFTGRIQPVR
jgi:hypothetical protein